MDAGFCGADMEMLLRDMQEVCSRLTAEQRAFVRSLIEYNTTGGKMTRARLTLSTCMAYDTTLARDHVARVSLANELLQGSFVVFDDLMDRSEYRRNKRCWHTIRGGRAMRDAYLIFALCKRYLVHVQAGAALGSFSEVAFRTSLGQTLDTLVSDSSCKTDVGRRYSTSTYRQICINKNAYYTFYFPIKLGLLLCGRREPETLRAFSETCGYLHQMQDDYLDFFPEKSGKTSNDLREGKCTWFVCQVLDRCGQNDSVLKHYIETRDEAAMMERVRGLYTHFFAEEKELLSVLRGMCEGNYRAIYKLCLGMLDRRRE